MPEALLYADAELLAGSPDLLLLARCLVEGYAHGLHRSPYAGSSQEFATYRAFLPGDPLQRIDWKVYGRTDDLYVREFEQETNLRGYLFLDASRSMDFGAGAGNKFIYGRLLCAVLAVLLRRQQDAPDWPCLEGVTPFPSRTGGRRAPAGTISNTWFTISKPRSRTVPTTIWAASPTWLTNATGVRWPRSSPTPWWTPANSRTC